MLNMVGIQNALSAARDFDAVLDRFKAVGIDAAIGGGAPRDALLGRERKDIDVMVMARDEAKLMQMVHAANFTPEMREKREVEYDGAEITGAWDLPDGVNAILMSPMLETWDGCIARNDFGICQVGYTTKRGFFWTEAFLKDAANQTFTLLRDGPGALRSMERYQRLQAKYQGWRLVRPMADEVYA